MQQTANAAVRIINGAAAAVLSENKPAGTRACEDGTDAAGKCMAAPMRSRLVRCSGEMLSCNTHPIFEKGCDDLICKFRT